MESVEACPICGSASAVKAKLVLIDKAWDTSSDGDPRLCYFVDIRLDDIKDELRPSPPLEQFVEGFVCERCNKGFVSEAVLTGERWRWRKPW